MARILRSALLGIGIGGLLVAADLDAQRNFVIDAAGGGQFRDLPAALAQARDGDVFAVRPGLYTPAVARAGVSLLADPGSELRQGTFLILGVSRGATFTMSGFRVAASEADVLVRAESCRGPVVLQDLASSPPVVPWAPAPDLRLEVVDSSAVTSSACAWAGNEPVHVRGTDSALALISSTAQGRGNPGNFSTAYSALRLVSGRLDVVDSLVAGGEGSSQPRVSGGIAAHVEGGSLRASTSTFRGGTSIVLISAWRVEAFDIRPGAQVVVDADVTLDPLPSLPRSQPTIAPVASIRVAPIRPGGVLTPTWSGPIGLPCVIGASLAGPGLATPWGPLQLDPGTLFTLYAGPSVAAPPTLTLIPAIPAGTALTAQGLVLLPSGRLQTTPASSIVVH